MKGEEEEGFLLLPWEQLELAGDLYFQKTGVDSYWDMFLYNLNTAPVEGGLC